MSSNTHSPASWVVLKFGGTSVANRARWQHIAQVVEKRRHDGYHVAVVHSAKTGLTNLLESFISHPEKQKLEAITDSVRTLCADLNAPWNTIEPLLAPLLSILDKPVTDPFQRAALLSLGERLTHAAGLAFLARTFDILSIDPRDHFVSHENDRRNRQSRALNATCNSQSDAALQRMADGRVILMPGYFLKDSHNHTVLLGRGGSDTSAAHLAVALEAEKLEIWTDVHGIFTANPRVVPTARLLTALDYQEAREIAASGGKVLHPRCILPLEENNIPLEIHHSGDPGSPFTTVHRHADRNQPQVRAINARHGITLVSIDSIDMWHQAGYLADVFAIFKQLGLSVDLISTAQTNITVSLDKADNVIEADALTALEERLATLGQVRIIRNCSAVTLVGHRIRALLHKVAPLMAQLAESRVYLTTQSSNDLNLTLVVDEDQADKLVKSMHESLISEGSQGAFGPTWEELTEKLLPTPDQAPPWWLEKRLTLLDIGHAHSPVYVYDEETIIQQIHSLKQLQAVDKILYAVKANPQADILTTMHREGLGFETVSPGEVLKLKEMWGDLGSLNILFTPNFAHQNEYWWAFDQDLTVTIDNLYALREWVELLRDRDIFLRLDPGHGEGHHRYVRTAGESSKFGISPDELDIAAALCRKHNIRVTGLHAHTGSGILNYENWDRILNFLGQQRDRFPHARVLDIGGGLGIKENPTDAGLNLKALDRMLLRHKKNMPEVELWIEPGRYLVANAGVLLGRVTQIKWKGETTYVGLDTGMNSLIRPALYGAWHPIVNLTRYHEEPSQMATIVGPLCETGDILGRDRHLPRCRENDIMLIANTGAYGRAMSSHYNLRAPAKELFLGKQHNA